MKREKENEEKWWVDRGEREEKWVSERQYRGERVLV